MDQLRQILDGINVVVRWWRDQSDTRGAVTQFAHIFIHLIAGQSATLTRFGALCHFDLDLIRVHQILRRHTEPTRSHLFDGGSTVIVEPFGVFAAFTGITLAPDRVHRDGEGLVCFFADRTEAHGSGNESFDDLLGRFDFFDRDRGVDPFLECQQTAQRAPVTRFVIDQFGVFQISFETVNPDSVLQFGDRIRVPGVVFAMTTVLIEPTDV
ncbi:MAG: hypothetical protein KatS3mg104_1143 [Phycisphaerae bacterium]|nr:MAG: hypothetical protein KatS3mg104_1143 [Phycisphaerae bacterium]